MARECAMMYVQFASNSDTHACIPFDRLATPTTTHAWHIQYNILLFNALHYLFLCAVVKKVIVARAWTEHE